MANDCDFEELWILSDRCSALQHLSGRSSSNDETSLFWSAEEDLSNPRCPPPHNEYYYMFTLEIMRSLIDW
ncbi:hypothetical protein TNIN_247071 [Trichonephila inaurata madagascariensis]|uniref:Uncharacterized protein n=1 Tax=Trichonephila inaurata madagascariensis TaxID=2747483 RepID=A0A8X6JVL6_9ARAC|nr:hypothetical protein TNIN_247071 [Trichonephila inaurata madagascariensis]